MLSVTPVFTEYERRVVREIALHQVRPNSIQRILDTLGRPVGRLLRFGREAQHPALRGISDRIQSLIQEGLIKTVQVACHFTGTGEILRRAESRSLHVADIESMKYLPISKLDEIADSFSKSNRLLLGAEGAVMGSATTLMEGVPGAQLVIPSLILADVTASLTLLSRQTCLISSVYGFPPKTPENIPHVIAALAPQTVTSDEGYLAGKAAVLASIREANRFAAATAGLVIDRPFLEKEAPQMIRLIGTVAERLGVSVTQKELGILIPIAGAFLNGSLNIAFQQVSHQTAKDYFRTLLLEDRYGEELVRIAIASEIQAFQLRQKSSSN